MIEGKKKKKLTLNKETVRKLTEEELDNAQGGMSSGTGGWTTACSVTGSACGIIMTFPVPQPPIIV